MTTSSLRSRARGTYTHFVGIYPCFFAHQRAFCSCSNIIRDNVGKEGSNTFGVRPMASACCT